MVQKRLADKVAWISGATSGIGEAAAYLFAQEGAAVAVVGRNIDKSRAIVAEIEAAGGQALAVKKNHPASAIGPVIDDTVEELENNLGEFNACKYTFQKDGHWYIKDLVNNTETVFTYVNFWQENWENMVS